MRLVSRREALALLAAVTACDKMPQRKVTIVFPQGGPLTPHILTGVLPQATVGQPYSVTLQATGGSPPYTWSMPANNLSWLSLSSAGVLSGTPNNTTTGNLTVVVTDSVNQVSLPAFFTLTVIAASGFTHAQQYQVTNSNIGVNTTPSFLVRDIGAAAVGTVDSQWSGFWPNANGGIYQAQNQNPATFSPTGALVGAPHPYITNFLAGCHYSNGQPIGFNTANNVMAWVNFTAPTFPYTFYLSGYVRNDPNWVYAAKPFNFSFGGTTTSGSNIITGVSAANIAKMQVDTVANVDAGPGISSVNTITALGASTVTLTNNAGAGAGTGNFDYVDANMDNNTKWTDYSLGTTPYNAQNIYCTYAGFNSTNSSTPPTTVQWGQNDDSFGLPNGSIVAPDDHGHNSFFWGTTTTLPWNQWIKLEYEAFITNLDGLSNGGQYNLFENGVAKITYAGKTDGMSGSARLLSLGGFCRQHGSNVALVNNFRYMADMRVGIGAGGVAVGSRFPRLVAGNAATLAACTDPIAQDIVSWASPTITFKFWKGTLATGSTVHFHVVTASGTVLNDVLNGTVN